jgi:hydrogenase maturation protease
MLFDIKNNVIKSYNWSFGLSANSERSESSGVQKKHSIVIGLGNEFISDDGVGIYAVRSLKNKINSTSSNFLFEELAVGGLQLLDYLVGYDSCTIIDAIVTGKHPAGTIYRYVQTQHQESVKLTTSHQIDLSQVLNLAKLFNPETPNTIRVYGIEVNDVTTFSTKCTPVVEKALPHLVELIYNDLFNDRDFFKQAADKESNNQWELIKLPNHP